MDSALSSIERVAGVSLIASGKVREIYSLGPGSLLLVTSDRISGIIPAPNSMLEYH